MQCSGQPRLKSVFTAMKATPSSSTCLFHSAYCKNSVDGQWYCFDDSEVSPVADDDVCQQTAYILFYQRRTAIPSWSANSSVAGWDLKPKCDDEDDALPTGRSTPLLQVRRARLCATTGSIGSPAVGLPAWPPGPRPDGPRWRRWPSLWSFLPSAMKTTVT